MSKWNQFQKQQSGKGYSQQQIAGMYQRQQEQQGGAYGNKKPVYVGAVTVDDGIRIAGFSMTLDGARKLLGVYVNGLRTGYKAVVIQTQFGKTYEPEGFFNEPHAYTMPQGQEQLPHYEETHGGTFYVVMVQLGDSDNQLDEVVYH